MGRFILPQLLLLTSDTLLNIGSEFAGGEGELASCRAGPIVLALRKSPLLSLPTFPCEMDRLVAGLDEGGGLPVVHVSRSKSGRKAKITPWLNLGNAPVRCWLCLGGCLLKAEEPRGRPVGRARQLCWPASSLACLSQKPGATASCFPLNLGHASGEAIIA